MRVDQFLASYLRDEFDSFEELEILSRNKVAQWLEEGLLRIDGQLCHKPSFRLKGGEQLELNIPFKKAITLEPVSDIPLEILFEDEHILIINKQAGLCMHPGAGQEERTLAHALCARLGRLAIGHPLRPGIVHRLDKDTSGVLVVAKTTRAYTSLQKQLLPPRSMSRRYVALCYLTRSGGRLLEKLPQRIEAPIGRHPTRRKEMSVVSTGGKEAVSELLQADMLENSAKLELGLHTGRTHQLRVHLAHVGLPIVGDPVYSRGMRFQKAAQKSAEDRLGRQALHASTLTFVHPESGERVSFEAPLPEDFSAMELALRGQ